MLSELNDNTVITEELIALIEAKAVSPYVLKWLREQPRTWGELRRDRPDWATWAMANIPDCPIDLNGLSSHNKSWVMSYRKDCPVDLSELISKDQAGVMMAREDCPLDYSGLTNAQKARVIAERTHKGWPI